MNTGVFTIVVCSMLSVGCQSALLTTMNENKAAEERISRKENELNALDTQQAALLNQQKILLANMDNLTADLDAKQMSLKELDARLDNLRKENARIKTETAAQQKKKESLDLEIKKSQAEIVALDKDNRLSDAEKRKKIEDLKKQISAHLKLMRSL